MTYFPSACGKAINEKFITVEEKIRRGNQTAIAVSECLNERYNHPFPKRSATTDKKPPEEILQKNFEINKIGNRRHNPNVVDKFRCSYKRNAGKLSMKTSSGRGTSHEVHSENSELNEVENKRHSRSTVDILKLSSKGNARKLSMKTSNASGTSHEVLMKSKTDNRRHSPSIAVVPKCSYKTKDSFSKIAEKAPVTASHEILNKNLVTNELKKYHSQEINGLNYLSRKENSVISKGINSPEIMIDHSEEEIFYQKLNGLILNLKECAKFRSDFQVGYPKWRNCRMENIELLNNLANELDELHKNCNVAKATANVSGIVSSICGIAGVMTGSYPLKLAATIGNFASNATSGVTTLVELKKTSDIIEKVKILILQDRQKFQNLMKWEAKSGSLMIAIQDICDYDIMQNVFNALIATIPETFSLSTKIDKIVNEVIRKIQNCTRQPLSPKSVTTITSLCEMSCNNSQLIPKIREVHELLKESTTLICAVKFSLNAFGNFYSNEKRSVFNKQLNSTLQYKTLACVAFETISIVSDVIALFKLQEDFKNGSVSQHSGKIRRVTNELYKELIFLEEMYYTI